VACVKFLRIYHDGPRKPTEDLFGLRTETENPESQEHEAGVLPVRKFRIQYARPEDGGSEVHRNFGILPHNYTSSQHRRHRPEDGGNEVLRNVGVFQHHYMSSQSIRNQLEQIPLLSTCLVKWKYRSSSCDHS
jgi:hypothetical protein